MTEELIILLLRGAFMLGTAKIEWSKVQERVKGVPPEKIPSILDAMYAESVQARDKAVDSLPEDQK